MPNPVVGAAGIGLVGSAMGASAQRSAANTQAAAQRDAATTQAYASSLRPVGLTTGLGSTSFTYETGPGGIQRVSGAEYSLDPRLRALQEQQYGMAPELLSGAYGLFGRQQAMVDPYAQQLASLSGQFLPTSAQYEISPEAAQFAAQQRQLGGALFGPDFSLAPGADVQAQQQRLQSLAQQVTPTSYDPTAAAQSYYQEQQALLDPTRQREEQRLGASVFGRGRAGLNISGQGQPELFALASAREQQNAQLAAQSRERARSELAQDINLGTQLGAAGIQTGQQGEAYQLGRLGSGLQYLGGGLQTQTAGQELARQNLLGNIQTGQGLFGASLAAQQAPYAALQSAYAPYNTALAGLTGIEDIGMGLQRQSVALGGGNPAQNIGSMFSAAAATQGQGQSDYIRALQSGIGNFAKQIPFNTAPTTGPMAGWGSSPIYDASMYQNPYADTGGAFTQAGAFDL